MDVVSFFAGAGGLDLGFQQAGFNVSWANEYDREIWETYTRNHLHTILDRRSIVDIRSSEVPDCDGIIGGPPCQSWSEAGAKRGITDKRGQLFYEFMRILADKKPKFFLAENVSGMLGPAHKSALENIKEMFKDCGYELSFELLNVSDYGVPQDRKRVFFVGYRKDLGLKFEFPKPTTPTKKLTLKGIIADLRETAVPAAAGNYSNGEACVVPNHEYMTGGFSSIFMSRNRVRSWDEVSFTIQAGGRHAPIHPQAPKMKLIGQDVREFVKGKEDLYRRLSVRECARIQTFPDSFVFHYKNIGAGYKMIGNAVPVKMGQVLAQKILTDLTSLNVKTSSQTFAAQNELNGSDVIKRMEVLINVPDRK
jgi:DNA (cytosine-5)-methyltransferase 1